MSSSENRLPRAYLGVLCAVLVLLPALTMVWAYNQISLASDDWSLLGRAVLQNWLYNDNEPQRPLLAISFTFWTVVSGDNFDVMQVINLWVLPALSSLVLFATLRGAFSVWLDGWRSAFAAFLVAAIYLVHPTDSSRPWLTMIVYHSTHLMLFGVMWLWCRAVLRNQPAWVLLAVVIATANNLIVEAQVFVYALMPVFLLLRPREVWARRGVWLAVSLGWYVAWGGYLYWRLVASAEGRREAVTPSLLGSVRFLWDNTWHALRLTAQNMLDSARALPDYGALAMGFAVAVTGVVLGAVVGLFWFVRRMPVLPKRPIWVGLGIVTVALAFLMAALFPYIAQYGDGGLLPTRGVASRAFQIPSVALAALTVLVVFWPRRLAIVTVVSAVVLAGGVLHQLRVTYDYVRAADYQRTLWAQFVAVPFTPTDVVMVEARRHMGWARTDGDVWGFRWGRRLMGALLPKEFLMVPEANQTMLYRDGQFFYGASRFSISPLNLRLYNVEPATGLLRPQTSTAMLGVTDALGQPVPLYTGDNRLVDAPRPSEYGQWFFSKPYTPTACWSFAVIQSPDTAPSVGDALIVNEFNGDILDRRPVAEGEALTYRAMLPCNFLMQVQFVPEDGEPVVLTGDGQDRTGGLGEEVTYRPAFEGAQALTAP
jgi:hypothetical protein